MSVHRYVFLGPQGSGKGTQADMLAAKLMLPHLSTGQLFRQAVAEGTTLGQRVAEGLAAGQLVPDDVTNQLIADWLQTPAAARGFILDGYPRNVAQASFLDGRAAVRAVVLLELSDDEAVARLSHRLHCPKCGRMYNTTSLPPQLPGHCDACGEALVRRDDDTEAAIRERLRLYHEETEPLLAHYGQRGVVVRVDGRPSVPDVFAAVCRVLAIP